MKLLIDLHLENTRQGPGGDSETRRAIKLAGLDKSKKLKIADIGCGTGAATLLLSKELNADITAVDFLPEFLQKLEDRVKLDGAADRVTTLNCSMDSLPFTEGEFDVIWSEGAIYNMGFKAGVTSWRQFLKPGGTLVVSEISWLTAKRPEELQSHWDREYPEINVASAKIAILEELGFTPMGYFILPKACWLDNYYRPLQNRFSQFLEQHDHSDQAKAIVDAEQKEISLYEKFCEHISYGVYVARKL